MGKGQVVVGRFYFYYAGVDAGVTFHVWVAAAFYLGLLDFGIFYWRTLIRKIEF